MNSLEPTILLYRSEVGFLHVAFDFAAPQVADDELVGPRNRAKATGGQHGVSVVLQNVVQLTEVLHQAGWLYELRQVHRPTEFDQGDVALRARRSRIVLAMRDDSLGRYSLALRHLLEIVGAHS